MPRTTETPPTGFASLGLSPEIVASVTALGYEEPTPVQREPIPVMLRAVLPPLVRTPP